MNHTPNYNLSQWEPGDPVQRADFNADNAKIDAALAARPEAVFGTYVGDGEASQHIVLGRRPKAVYVCDARGLSSHNGFSMGGLALDGFPTTHYGLAVLEVTEAGFAVHYAMTNGGAYIHSNNNRTEYHYAAFF